MLTRLDKSNQITSLRNKKLIFTSLSLHSLARNKINFPFDRRLFSLLSNSLLLHQFFSFPRMTKQMIIYIMDIASNGVDFNCSVCNRHLKRLLRCLIYNSSQRVINSFYLTHKIKSNLFSSVYLLSGLIFPQMGHAQAASAPFSNR